MCYGIQCDMFKCTFQEELLTYNPHQIKQKSIIIKRIVFGITM